LSSRYIFIAENTNMLIVHAASLNYRDLIIPKGKYPFPMKDNIVPGSDGSGTVEAVGKHVTRFQPGGA
jgi:NADPH:quinone reductase-like Zn-dependent oxidoreductase